MSMNDPRPADVALVTGFPALTARRTCEQLLAAGAEERVHLLVATAHTDAAARFVATLPADAAERLQIVEGDVADMDLGLPGGEYKALASEITLIHHAASVHHLGVRRELVERGNVDGTRNILELAGDAPKLRRLVHWSTAQVSGTRTGVILEEELDCGQRFYNLYEETKFRAERIVREADRRLPVTILRPGLIVGDSRTGEIDRFDGPYYLIVLIVTSPIDVPLPLPGRGAAPLSLVPIDFVVDAAVALGRDPRAVGATFHLTDPAPFSARTVYELVAQRAERKPPRGSIPSGLARALLKTPGLERLTHSPLSFLDSFDHFAVYNCRHTLRLAAGGALACPPFDDYVDALVRYVRKVHADKRLTLDPVDEPHDPLDRG